MLRASSRFQAVSSSKLARGSLASAGRRQQQHGSNSGSDRFSLRAAAAAAAASALQLMQRFGSTRAAAADAAVLTCLLLVVLSLLLLLLLIMMASPADQSAFLSTPAFFSLSSPYFNNLPPLRSNSSSRCPDWFHFIRSDLKPWRQRGGITQFDVDAATLSSGARVKIIDGKMFGELYGKAFETRDFFSLWGLLQLLRTFPGQVPDVDILFSFQDFANVYQLFHNASYLPVMFAYCRPFQGFFDLLWPDWSFWGWPEVGLDEWHEVRRRILNSSSQSKWEDRKPLAFWKGAAATLPGVREALVQCNDGDEHKWGVEAYDVNWAQEKGQRHTKPEEQCGYRYKVYCEGRTWSASLKYIMACGSTPIFIAPEHEDFYSRGLKKGFHFLEVDHPEKSNVCRNMKRIVSTGNKQGTSKMEEVGNASRAFIEDLTMKRVYEYMLYTLREYAKLQLFKPCLEPTSNMEEITEDWVKENLRKYCAIWGDPDFSEQLITSQEQGLPCTFYDDEDPL